MKQGFVLSEDKSFAFCPLVQLLQIDCSSASKTQAAVPDTSALQPELDLQPSLPLPSKKQMAPQLDRHPTIIAAVHLPNSTQGAAASPAATSVAAQPKTYFPNGILSSLRTRLTCGSPSWTI